MRGNASGSLAFTRATFAAENLGHDALRVPGAVGQNAVYADDASLDAWDATRDGPANVLPLASAPASLFLAASSASVQALLPARVPRFVIFEMRVAP